MESQAFVFLFFFIFIVVATVIIIKKIKKQPDLKNASIEINDYLLDAKIKLFDPKIRLLYNKLGKPVNDFMLSKEEISYFVNHNYNFEAISFIVRKILFHLKMPFVLFNLRIYVDNEVLDNTAGTYSYVEGKPTITINLKSTYSYEQIIAILCHECMHHFLFSKSIKLDIENDNEILTDVATVYMGFYLYMRKGYKETVKEETLSDRKKILTTKIGYIDTFQIDYIYGIVQKLRNEIAFEDIHKSELEIQKERANKEYRELLKKECEILYEVIKRNQEIISIISDNKIDVFSERDFEIIQENILNVENEMYVLKYNRFKHIANGKNLIDETEYTKLKNDIDKLCAEITFMTSTVGKYI